MKMKLRIMEDLTGCGENRWFRLERWSSGISEDRWVYVSGSIRLSDLEIMAKNILANAGENVLVKEFSNDPPDSVGPPADSLVAP
jgi:hypothetical protein